MSGTCPSRTSSPSQHLDFPQAGLSRIQLTFGTATTLLTARSTTVETIDRMSDVVECPGGCGWAPHLCHCTNKLRSKSEERIPVIINAHQAVRLVGTETVQLLWCPLCGSVFGDHAGKKLFQAPSGSKSTETSCLGVLERGKGAFPFLAKLSEFFKP